MVKGFHDLWVHEVKGVCLPDEGVEHTLRTETIGVLLLGDISLEVITADQQFIQLIAIHEGLDATRTWTLESVVPWALAAIEQ